MPDSVSLEIGGRTLVIETGELAKQANGSALVRYGDSNVVLAAVTASEKPREGIDFFPLTCEYEERMYAAGKIPGGYIKREGRPSEHGILSARQIDRPIRPLFPDGFQNDVQIITTVLSIDPQLDSDVLAVCAAGAALAVSDIPFDKNVAAVRVGREDGKYVINPTLPQYDTGGMEIVVAGTMDAVMMVEGGGNEMSEEDFLGAVEFGHEEIKRIVKQIDALAKKHGKKKRAYPLKKVDPTLEAWVEKTFKKDIAKAMRITEKAERNAAFDKITIEEAKARCKKTDGTILELLNDAANAKDFGKVVKAVEEEELRVMVVDEKIRPDGRKADEIRAIWSKVGYLRQRSVRSATSSGSTA